jgi:ATP-dependent DNA helicase RecG
VIVVEVDRYPDVCATKAGVCVRRAMGTQGPQCIPFYPHEHVGRRATLGLLDFSAQPCEGSTAEDLNPLEFERLRQTIQRLHGDPALLELPDIELAKALQLVETTAEGLVPNIAGLLLLGREDPLRRIIPTHEAAFQVLDARGDVRVNDFFRSPLLTTVEEVQQRFDARVEEEEVMIGMFRLPIPEYGRVAFREAMLNALLHRDYSQMGTVFVQWHHDHLLITNPGGLPDGITLQNILVHEPKPRNPRLYEAAKRIGLVEKTGRGVDKIFLDQLRYGRPAPNYDRSDASGVRVVLRGGKANLVFARFVYEQDKAGQPLTLEELLILNQLEAERRLNTTTAAVLIQKPEGEARAVLERLSERGLLQARGETRGRVYHLSATSYKALGIADAYVRARGFEPFQQAQMVLQYVDAHGKITRSQTANLCHVSESQATRLLKKMSKNGILRMEGRPPKGAFYVRNRS